MVQSGENRFLAAFLDPSHRHWFHGAITVPGSVNSGRSISLCFPSKNPTSRCFTSAHRRRRAILEASSVTSRWKTGSIIKLAIFLWKRPLQSHEKLDSTSATTGNSRGISDRRTDLWPRLNPVFRSIIQIPPSRSNRSTIFRPLPGRIVPANGFFLGPDPSSGCLGSNRLPKKLFGSASTRRWKRRAKPGG